MTEPKKVIFITPSGEEIPYTIEDDVDVQAARADLKAVRFQAEQSNELASRAKHFTSGYRYRVIREGCLLNDMLY